MKEYIKGLKEMITDRSIIIFILVMLIITLYGC